MLKMWQSWVGGITHAPIDIILFDQQRVHHGWHLARRHINEHLVYGLLDGGVSYQLDDQPWQQVHGPALLWIMPHVTHAFRLIDPAQRFRLINIRWRNDHALPDQAPPMMIWQHPHQGLQSLALAYQHYHERHSLSDAMLQAQLAVIHTGLLHHHYRPQQHPKGLTDSQRRAVSDLVIQTGPEHLQPHDIAEHLGLSSDYFTRQFRLSYGVAPRTWLVQQRLHRVAIDLTEGGDSISTLAERYHFANGASLSHSFKKHYGISPGRYRSISSQ